VEDACPSNPEEKEQGEGWSLTAAPCPHLGRKYKGTPEPRAVAASTAPAPMTPHLQACTTHVHTYARGTATFQGTWCSGRRRYAHVCYSRVHDVACEVHHRADGLKPSGDPRIMKAPQEHCADADPSQHNVSCATGGQGRDPHALYSRAFPQGWRAQSHASHSHKHVRVKRSTSVVVHTAGN
jgi:hypothetical protein